MSKKILRIFLLGYYIALCTSAHFGNAQKSTSKFSIKSEKSVNIPKQIIIGSNPGMTSFSFKSATQSKPSVSVKSTKSKSVATSRSHIFKHEPKKQQFSSGYPQQNIQRQKYIPPPPPQRYVPPPPPQQYVPPPPPQQYVPTPPPQQYIPPPPQQNIPQPPPNRNIPMPPPNKFQPPRPPPNQGSGFHYQTVVSSHNPINMHKFVFSATTYHAYPQGNATSDLHGYAIKSKRHNNTNNNTVVEGNSRIVDHNTIHSMPGDAAFLNLSESSGRSVMRANKIATQTVVKENNNAQSKMFYFRIPISEGINKTNTSPSKSSSQATLNAIQNDREKKLFEDPSDVYRNIVSDHLNALFAKMPIFSFSASTNNYTIRNRNTSKTHSINHVNTLQNIVRLDVLPELKSNRFTSKVSDRSDGSTHGSLRRHELFRANINMSDVRFKLAANYTERKKNIRNAQRINALSGIISKQQHISSFNNKEYVSINDIGKSQRILGNHIKAASTYVVSIPIGQHKNSSNYVPIVNNNELPINQRDKTQQFMNTEHKPKVTYVLTYPLEKKNISSRISNLTETRHPSVTQRTNISSRMSNLTETRHPSVEPKKNISARMSKLSDTRRPSEESQKNISSRMSNLAETIPPPVEPKKNITSRMSNLTETRPPPLEPKKNISSRMSNLTETRPPPVEPKKNIISRMSNLTETRHPSEEPKKNISSRMSNLTETRPPPVEPKKHISSRMSNLTETRPPPVEPKKDISSGMSNLTETRPPPVEPKRDISSGMSNLTETRHPPVEPKKHISSGMSNLAETRPPPVEPKKIITSRMPNLSETEYPSMEPKHGLLVNHTMNQTIKASNIKTLKNISNNISTIDTTLSNVSDFDVFRPNNTDDRLTLVKPRHNSIANIQLPPIIAFDDKIQSKTLSDIQYHGITTIGVKPPIVASILNKKLRQAAIYDLEIPLNKAVFDVTIPVHTTTGVTIAPAASSDVTIMPVVTASDIIIPAFPASEATIPASDVTKSAPTRSDVTIPVYAASDLTIPAFQGSGVIMPAVNVYDVTIPAVHTASDVTQLAATETNVTQPVYPTSDVTIPGFPVSDVTKPVHKASDDTIPFHTASDVKLPVHTASDVTLPDHTAAGKTMPVVTAHAKNTPIVAVPDVNTIADTASDKIHINAMRSSIPAKPKTTEFRNPSNRVDDFQIFNSNEILTRNNTVKQYNDLLIENKLTNKNVIKQRHSAMQTLNAFGDDAMLDNDVIAPTIDVFSHQEKPLDSIDHPSEITIITAPKYNSFIPNADVLTYFAPELITGFGSKDTE